MAERDAAIARELNRLIEGRMSAAMARGWHAGARAHPWAWNRPGAWPGLCCWFVVEPPAGIEPATPSLPWNHREPLCGTPFPQLTPDRRHQSYRFSFGQVMRSLQSRLIAAGVGHHPAQRSPTQPAFLLIISCSLLGGGLSSPWSTTGRVARRSPPGRPPQDLSGFHLTCDSGIPVTAPTRLAWQAMATEE
jgi:hypothetical protein